MKTVIAVSLSGAIFALSSQSLVTPAAGDKAPESRAIPVTLCATGRTLWLTLPVGPKPFDPPHEGPMPCHASCVLREADDEGADKE